MRTSGTSSRLDRPRIPPPTAGLERPTLGALGCYDDSLLTGKARPGDQADGALREVAWYHGRGAMDLSERASRCLRPITAPSRGSPPPPIRKGAACLTQTKRTA